MVLGALGKKGTKCLKGQCHWTKPAYPARPARNADESPKLCFKGMLAWTTTCAFVYWESRMSAGLWCGIKALYTTHGRYEKHRQGQHLGEHTRTGTRISGQTPSAGSAGTASFVLDRVLHGESKASSLE